MSEVIKIAFLDDGISPDFLPDGISFENYIADEHGVRADNNIGTN